MILAVDAGNTNITLGCVEGREIHSIARMETSRHKTEYEYAVMMERILSIQGVTRSDFEGAVISSVVPPLTGVLSTAVKFITGYEALIIGSGIKTGLNIGIDDPSTLGADLVAGAVAALDLHAPPLVIIDMGTATTMSVLDEKSRLLGGAILPGPGVSMDALAGTANLLPHISLDAPERCISSNTIECMKSGAVFGAAGAIDGLLDRMEAELGQELFVVATGGLSKKILPHCRHKMTIDDDLLLRGLGIIWEKNRKRR